MRRADYLLVDVSNSFTKIAFVRDGRHVQQRHLPTGSIDGARMATLVKGWEIRLAVISSVVPSRNAAFVLPGTPIHWVSHRSPLGVSVDYPRPSTIGADRLANAAGCADRYGCPAIVVDFGTAVTFDVLSPDGAYVGGVIAPGLSSMTEYLHQRTALLPRLRLKAPARAIGRSTREAMLSGAVFGYRGLVRGICEAVAAEFPPDTKVPWIATGGDAEVIAAEGLFSTVDPQLTLHGLHCIAQRVENTPQ